MVDKTISLGPKRSIETNISKKGCFHDDKSFWPFVPLFIECDKPQGIFNNDQAAVSTITLQFKKAFFLRSRRLLKTQSFEIEANFPLRKRFWPLLSLIIEHDECQKTVYRRSQCILTIIVQMIRSFLWDQRGRKKQTFQKIAVFTVTKGFGSFFLVFSSVTNIMEQLIKVEKLFLQ